MRVFPEQEGISALFLRYRRPVSTVVYAVVTAAAYLLAYQLRFEFNVPSQHYRTLLFTLPILGILRVGTVHLFQITMGRWRFVGLGDVARLVCATSVGSSLFFLGVTWGSFSPAVPKSVVVIEWMLTILITAGIWMVYRGFYEVGRRRDSVRNGDEEKRIVIVGAGEAGNRLAREIVRFHTGYRLAGFVDDDPLKWGTVLHGVRVMGGTAELASIAQAVRAEEIIIASPSASPQQLRALVNGCEELPIPFKVLPGIREVIEGNDIRLSQLRPLQIEDLLGREPIHMSLPELREDLTGKVVLVTGAAGSIGSELCRQVAANGPEKLIAFDQAESDLFFVEQELRESHPDLSLVFVVGSILDEQLVETVFETHGIDRIYHAAAYKHVPLMEENVRAAVLNNVLGTLRLAQAAGRYEVGKFVLISTDKAVRPSSVMGATKRLAEIAVISCQERFEATTFTAVRFGNVLGSNGSVVPIFQRLLAARKPLTVTHPDVTRYFMTISEAVQLVLQASLLPEAAGRVTMLDMGEPVRIIELAQKMIALSGLDSASIPIIVTGLRPGEKLHEELAHPEEIVRQSSTPRVNILGRTRHEVDLSRVEMSLCQGLTEDGARAILRELLAPTGELVS